MCKLILIESNFVLFLNAGSPWRVDVINPVPITVTGQGLGTVPVNRMTYFDIGASSAVFDPSLAQVQITGFFVALLLNL